MRCDSIRFTLESKRQNRRDSIWPHTPAHPRARTLTRRAYFVSSSLNTLVYNIPNTQQVPRSRYGVVCACQRTRRWFFIPLLTRSKGSGDGHVALRGWAAQSVHRVGYACCVWVCGLGGDGPRREKEWSGFNGAETCKMCTMSMRV